MYVIIIHLALSHDYRSIRLHKSQSIVKIVTMYKGGKSMTHIGKDLANNNKKHHLQSCCNRTRQKEAISTSFNSNYVYVIDCWFVAILLSRLSVFSVTFLSRPDPFFLANAVSRSLCWARLHQIETVDLESTRSILISVFYLPSLYMVTIDVFLTMNGDISSIMFLQSCGKVLRYVGKEWYWRGRWGTNEMRNISNAMTVFFNHHILFSQHIANPLYVPQAVFAFAEYKHLQERYRLWILLMLKGISKGLLIWRK